MSESKEGARSPQRSERVLGGVRGSKWAWLQNTGGYTRSPDSAFLFSSSQGCLHRLVPERLGVASRTCHANLERETIVSFRRNRHPIRKQTAMWREGGLIFLELHVDRSGVFDDCGGCCWLSARHRYQDPWIFSDQVNKADSTWHV